MRIKLMSIALVAMLLCQACTPRSVDEKKVAIIVPLEHRAMTEIVSGFKKELAKRYHGKVQLLVKNAEHDPQLEQSIIEQLKSQGVDIIEPIGTDAFEMALARTRHATVIGIAADLTAQQRKQYGENRTTAVIDELSEEKQLKFIHLLLPDLKRLTVIHSAVSKIFSEVKALKMAAEKKGIEIQDLTVPQESDLSLIAHHISEGSQAIFILKDSMVVNGVATLVKQAEKLRIPLISSDDGSVQNGATLALGVYEHEIGRSAADLTARILNGQSLATLPISHLEHLHVFVNQAMLQRQGLSVSSVTAAAKQQGYDVIKLKSQQGVKS
jgi:putative tryptophan/tyrosine transport system substrate-binding protein